MIHIYYGENRALSDKNAKKVLGEKYETIDAENLEVSDLPTLFLGTSLFETESRKILIRGLAEKKELFDELQKYLETPHEVVVLETKIDGKWTSLKELKKCENVDVVENKFEEDTSKRFLAFNIYDLALNNPEKALKMLKENEENEDPYAMLGAWSTSAIKNLKNSPNSKQNKNILKELSRIDMLMKTTKFSEEPWMLLESFLLRIKTL